MGFFDKENYGDNQYQKQYEKEMAKKKAKAKLYITPPVNKTLV
jgi:hypothetical protein